LAAIACSCCDLTGLHRNLRIDGLRISVQTFLLDAQARRELVGLRLAVLQLELRLIRFRRTSESAAVASCEALTYCVRVLATTPSCVSTRCAGWCAG
jgi:hypothetical protein